MKQKPEWKREMKQEIQSAKQYSNQPVYLPWMLDLSDI